MCSPEEKCEMLQEGDLRRVYFHNSTFRTSLCVYLYTSEACTGLNSTFHLQKLKNQGGGCLYFLCPCQQYIAFIETNGD